MDVLCQCDFSVSDLSGNRNIAHKIKNHSLKILKRIIAVKVKTTRNVAIIPHSFRISPFLLSHNKHYCYLHVL